MTKIYVWPDASYLDADEYNEVEFNHKGEDLITIDLQEIVDGRTALVYTGSHVELVLKGRLSELLQAEHQLKATSTMFRNYRNTMREHLAWLHAEQAYRITKLSAEQAAILANKEQEIKTILAARDQWVKELQGKLREAATDFEQATTVNSEMAEENRRLKSQLAGATARIRKQIDGYGRPRLPEKTATEAGVRLLVNEKDKLAAKVDSLEAHLSELYQVLGALDAPVKVLDLVTKVLDGHGFDPETDSLLPFICEKPPIRPEDDWEYRAKRAESELAKLRNTSAISSDIEDNLRKERARYATLLAKHGVCTDCGDMYEHHEDEPLASCACGTTEWPEAPLSPYMLLQRRIKQLEDSNAEDESFAVQELKGEIRNIKCNVEGAIALLQEIE